MVASILQSLRLDFWPIGVTRLCYSTLPFSFLRLLFTYQQREDVIVVCTRGVSLLSIFKSVHPPRELIGIFNSLLRPGGGRGALSSRPFWWLAVVLGWSPGLTVFTGTAPWTGALYWCSKLVPLTGHRHAVSFSFLSIGVYLLFLLDLPLSLVVCY